MMANLAAAQRAVQAEQMRVAQQRASIIQQQQARASFSVPNNAAAAAAAVVAMQEQQAAQQQARASFMLNAAGVGGGAGGINSFLQQLQQQAQLAALAQMNASSSMVGTAKLANSSKNKDSNSTLVVRSSVPKLNMAGGLYTVAQWARKCVEDNLEFIVKLGRRSDPKAKAVMLTYGDSGETQTLVLFDDQINKLPTDLKKIQMVGIGVSSSFADDKRDEGKMAANGVLQPTDCMWEHLKFEQMSTAASASVAVSGEQQEGTSSSKTKGPKIMFLHTLMATYRDGHEGCRRVLQVKTLAGEGKPFVATSFCPNPVFEQQVLELWAAQTGGGGGGVRTAMLPTAVPQASFAPVPGVAAAAASASASAVAKTGGEDDDDYDTLITFNPRELLILERAFDNNLRKMDLNADVTKWTEKDKIECQATIARANAEFKYYTVRGPKKAKAASKKRKTPPADEEKDKTPKEAATPAKKKNATPKSKVDRVKKLLAPHNKPPDTHRLEKDTTESSATKTPVPSAKKGAEKSSLSTKKKTTHKDIKKKETPSKSNKATVAKETESPSSTKKQSSPVKKTPAKKAPAIKAAPKKKSPATATIKSAVKAKTTPAKKSPAPTKAKTVVKAKRTSPTKKSPTRAVAKRGLKSAARPANTTRSKSRSRARK